MRRPIASTLGALSNDSLSTSLDELEGETHARWLDLAEAVLEELGFELTVRSTRRTCAQQFALYQIGRGAGDSRATVTKANGCLSWHVLGRAVDFDPPKGQRSSANYAAVGAIAKRLGWKWGGDFPGFPDVGHVEWHPGMTIEQVCPNPLACSDEAVDTKLPNSDAPAVEGGVDPDESGERDSSALLVIIAGVVAATIFTVWRR